MNSEVIVMIGAGGIGMAIARRQGFGKHILLADFNDKLLERARKELEDASYKVSTLNVDVSSRDSVIALAEKAASLGSVINVVNTAGVSPNMASPERILQVDLYGSAVVFEEFENVIAHGGSALIISSMAGYMMPSLHKEQNEALAFTPAGELLRLPFLGPESIPNSMVAYIMSKRANHLRVQASSISWGKRGARVNSISPGTIAREGSGRRMSPLRVKFVQPRTQTRALERHFGCPVFSDAARNAIIFRAEDAATPFVTRNAELLEMLAPQLDQELRARTTEEDHFIDLVRGAIQQRLTGHRPIVDDIAKELHMSPRTLQRRLQDVGSSYQRVLDDARHQMARYYLSNSVLELAEAAYLLGYEDANSFARAFRAWEGMPPKNWREAQRATAANAARPN